MDRIQYILEQFSFLACFQAFLLAFALIFIKKGDKQLNIIFAALLIASGWSGIYYSIDMMGKAGDYPTIAYTNFLTDYFYNPLIYLYVLRLTSSSYKFNRRSLLHFIPVLLMFIYYANYYFAPVSVKLVIFHRGYNYFPWDVAIFSYANLLQFLIYIVIGAVALQKYGIRIKQYYSEVGKRNYDWLKFILLYSLGSAILCFFLYSSGYLVFHQLIALSASILIYVIGYKMIASPPYAPEFENTPMSSSKELPEILDSSVIKYEKSGLSDEKSAALAQQLSKLMADEKPWLDPELTLKDLADKIKIPPHHLSQIINQRLHKNFYDYINEFRVNEVKSKLSTPKFEHLTLLAIGLDSGFNSKASFNNVFRKFTGKSPSEYKKEIAPRIEQVDVV